MLLPINWLKQFTTVNESAEEVAARFTALGFECELKGESVIDLDITPNRGDVLSILGLAREYAASTDQTLTMPEVAQLDSTSQLPGVTLESDPKAYHRLSATVVKGVKIEPSPDWLREAVESVGMNSINNIVDLTNYVMFELGIPMHAFDLDKIPSGQLKLRPSKAGEQFISLKDELVELPADAIVVESGGQLIDLVGIRGGKNSMITQDTTNLLIWGLSLPRPLIRMMVKKTGLRTEGAYRHERETDWLMTEASIARIAFLIKQLGSGEVTSVLTMEATPLTLPVITWQRSLVKQLLGTDYSDEAIDSSLTRLGFKVVGNEVSVPSWRMFDVTLPEDLVEEVARIQGYSSLPRRLITPVAGPTETLWARIENLKDQLCAAGFTEAYTESFAGVAEVKALGLETEQLDVLSNPVNRDFAFCRPTAIPSLVKLLSLNAWSDQAAVFEVTNIFPRNMVEKTVITLAAYGNDSKRLAGWAPSNSILLIDVEHPLAKLYKLRRAVVVAEVSVADLLERSQTDYSTNLIKPNYRPVSAFPPSVRDVALIVDDSLDPQTLITTVYDIDSEHIVLVELFDQFRSDKFGQNKQSLGVRIVYQSTDKTFDSGEVDAIHQRVTDRLIREYKAEIR